MPEIHLHNWPALTKQAGLQHRDTCKALSTVMDRYEWLKEARSDISDDYKNPFVYLRQGDVEDTEDAHGNPIIRVWMECQECNVSGFMDIKAQKDFYIHIKPEVKKTPSMAANRMGGPDVSEKYVNGEHRAE